MNARLMFRTAVALLALSCFAFAADKDPDAKAEKPAKSAKTPKPLPKLGEPAPTFTLSDFNGKTFDLAAAKDKVVVLEWFNCDCPFCKMFCEDLKKTQASYAGKGVIWVAVDSTSFRKNDENAKYAKEHKIEYPILSDFDGKVGHLYGATNTPHVFIINKGKLEYVGAFMDMSKKNNYTAAALDNILAGKPVSKDKTKPFG